MTTSSYTTPRISELPLQTENASRSYYEELLLTGGTPRSDVEIEELVDEVVGHSRYPRFFD